MLQDADGAFFRKILYNKTHVLHTYVPERIEVVYYLRSRKHSKCLIDKTTDFLAFAPWVLLAYCLC